MSELPSNLSSLCRDVEYGMKCWSARVPMGNLLHNCAARLAAFALKISLQGVFGQSGIITLKKLFQGCQRDISLIFISCRIIFKSRIFTTSLDLS